MDYHARKDSMQQSLFGDTAEVQLTELSLPDCRPWSKLEQLKFEKEVTGFYMSGHPLDDYNYELTHFCSVTIEDLKQDLKPLKGKEVTFAGIVIEANHKVGKTGKPFGSFVVEDYFNFISLNVFSEEFLKWKHLIEAGQYVYIRGRIESRFDNPDQMVVRIIHMSLLQEVMEKMSKTFFITVGLNELAEDLPARLLSKVKQNRGQCPLRIRIFDPIENISIDLPSKKHRVNAKELMKALEELPELQVRIVPNTF